MKRLRSMGLGVRKKQAEPISIQEDLLWERGCLGDHAPNTLLDTMLFPCGIHFALRRGEEHCSLRISQIEIQHDENGSECLLYTKILPKTIKEVFYIEKWNSSKLRTIQTQQIPSVAFWGCFKCMSDIDWKNAMAHFTSPPLRKPKHDVWYSKVPVGHNTSSKMVGRLCKKAGISGFKINHLLRVTSTTYLFQSEADEQLIMAHTGHRNVDGVCMYKRVSEEQKKITIQS